MLAKKKTLIVLDGTDFRRQILPHVKNLLSTTEYDIFLLRVAPVERGFIPDPPVQDTPEFRDPSYRSVRDVHLAKHPIFADQVMNSRQAELEETLRQDVLDFQEAGYAVSMEVRFTDEPSKAVLNCIREQSIGLVAMTTHGRTGLNRLLFGNMAEKIMLKVAVPIMLLHPYQAIEEKAA